jgi:probable phosphoglycerate mutase
VSGGTGTEDASEGIPQRPWVPPTGATTILLVRHGATMPEHPDRPHPFLDGQGDPDLAPEGVDQAEAVGRRLAAEHAAGDGFSGVTVSSLRRTHQTAAPLVRATGLPVTEIAELREVHLGEWEGRFRQRVADGDPLFAEALRTQRWDVIPGAESSDVFEARLRIGIERIVAAHRGGRVVAVVHGGVIGQLLSTATGAGVFEFSAADNGSISELVVDGGSWRVRRFNDTSHLD